jgi:hypothetical protein
MRPVSIIVFASCALTFLIVTGCGRNPAGPNSMPRIISLFATPDTVIAPEYNMITCSAEDDDGDHLVFDWGYAPGGSFSTPVGDNFNDTIFYQPAPCCSGPQVITCIVSDGKGGSARDSITIYTNIF